MFHAYGVIVAASRDAIRFGSAVLEEKQVLCVATNRPD